MSRVPVTVDLYYSGAWHDITATNDVYTRDPITITRDFRAGAGQSLATLSIENSDGKYSPRLPTSTLYGLIGRNTPLRVAVDGYDVTADTFNRVVAEGWGTSEYDATAWLSNGSGGSVGASDYHIDEPLTAVHSVPATSAFRFSYLSTVFPVNTTVTARVRALDTAGGFDILGGDIEGGLILRFQDVSHYYHPRVEFNADQTITASLHAIGGTGSIGSATPAAAITYAGQWLVVKAQATGSTVRMKVWEDGDPEPVAWDVSVTDTQYPDAGGVGLRSGVATGNTNTGRHIHYRNFTTDHAPRITGEVESWPLRWNVKGNDVWAPVNVFGIMRRLGAPGTKAPARSALWRLIAAGAIMVPVAWWALEEGPFATITASGLPDGQPMVAQSGTPGIGDCGPALPGVVDFRNGGVLRAMVPDDGNFVAATGWTVEWTARFERNSQDAVFPGVMVGWRTDNATLSLWTTQAGTASGPALFFGNDSANQGSTGSHPEVTPYDGVTRHYRVTAKQNGANIDVALYADGELVAVGDDFGGGAATVTGTLGRVTEVFVNDGLGGEAQPYNMAGLCQVTVYNSADHGIDTHLAAHGYVGETAADRIERLCTEDGIAVTILGDPDRSEPVGPQRVAPFLELLHDAADADGGALYEPRGFLGLAYRTHWSLYNQDAAATLDYADGGEVAPPLTPVEDTDHVGNDITVTRYLGGSSRAVKETGTLNVQEPTTDPDGVGRIPKEYTLVLAEDSQTFQQAAWKRHLGTWDEARFPVVRMDLTAMSADSKTELIGRAASLDIGDRLAITSTPAWLPPEDIEQHAQGFAETIESHLWSIDASATPAKPYSVGILDDTTQGRLDNDACTLNEVLDTTETGVDVISVNTPWGSQFPYDIEIGGEVMTVSARSGAGLTQTLTVTRSVNGVVKSHPATGVPVRLHDPLRLAR